jgi:hypothetical protein
MPGDWTCDIGQVSPRRVVITTANLPTLRQRLGALQRNGAQHVDVLLPRTLNKCHRYCKIEAGSGEISSLT